MKLTFQGHCPSSQEPLSSLAFIHYTDASGLMRPALGVGWALNFEMFFYAITALMPFSRPAWRYGLLMVVLTVFGASGGHLPWIVGLGLERLLLAKPLLIFLVTGVAAGMLVDQLKLTWPTPAPPSLAGAPEWPRADDSGQGRLVRWAVLAGDGSVSTCLQHGFVMGPPARVVAALEVPMGARLFAAAMVFVRSMGGGWSDRHFERPSQRGLLRLFKARQPVIGGAI